MYSNNLYVLAIGKVAFTTTGNCNYFSVYEEWKNSDMKMAICADGTTIFGCMGASILGTKTLIGDQSGRRMREVEVLEFCDCDKEKIVDMLKKHGFIVEKPKAFQKQTQKAKRMSISYVLK